MTDEKKIMIFVKRVKSTVVVSVGNYGDEFNPVNMDAERAQVSILDAIASRGRKKREWKPNVEWLLDVDQDHYRLFIEPDQRIEEALVK